MNGTDNLLEPIELEVSKVSKNGRSFEFTATQEQRSGLANAFNLLSLEHLSASMKLKRCRWQGVVVTGHLSASLSQPCVISLKPVAQIIDEEFTHRFLPDDRILPGSTENGELQIEFEQPEPPEAFSGDIIDLSLVIIENLSLAIDPFPKLPDAALPPVPSPPSTIIDEAPSPFAVLSQLKVDHK